MDLCRCYYIFFQIYYVPSKSYEVSSNDFDGSVMNMNTSDNGTIFVINGLIPETTYTVYLSAFTGAGEGNNSTNVTMSTPTIGK